MFAFPAAPSGAVLAE